MAERLVADPRWTLTWCRGPDAVSFLQGLLSADLTVEPGSVTRSFLLQPQGKVVALFWVLVGSEEVGLLTDDVVAEEAIAALRRYRIRVKADFEADDRPVRVLLGEPGPSAWSDVDGVLRADVSAHGEARSLLVGSDLPVTVSSQEWDARRIAVGEPVSGVDIGDQTIPQETGLVPETVSFTKGCYLGQELVARIDTRGRVNQRLMVVEAEGPVAPGDVVVGADREAVLTSVAPAGDGWVALASVRREVEDGAAVIVRSHAGEVPAKVREP
jgi:folate-binding protein YgfZ